MSMLNWFSFKKKVLLSEEERTAQIDAMIQSYVDTHKSSDPIGVRVAYIRGLLDGSKMAGALFGVKD